MHRDGCETLASFSDLPTVQFLITYRTQSVSSQNLDSGKGLGTRLGATANVDTVLNTRL